MMIASGMLVGSLAMWVFCYLATGETYSPSDISRLIPLIVAAYASMLGSGLTGYAIRSGHRKR